MGSQASSSFTTASRPSLAAIESAVRPLWVQILVQMTRRIFTVLGQKDSSNAHFTPKVADFATLPQATIFIRIHKNLAVY